MRRLGFSRSVASGSLMIASDASGLLPNPNRKNMLETVAPPRVHLVATRRGTPPTRYHTTKTHSCRTRFGWPFARLHELGGLLLPGGPVLGRGVL